MIQKCSASKGLVYKSVVWSTIFRHSCFSISREYANKFASSVLSLKAPSAFSSVLYMFKKRGLVNLLRASAFFGLGSGWIIRISCTDFSSKKLSKWWIIVRKNATFLSQSIFVFSAPYQSLAPFTSTPIKFLSGKWGASPTVYSPLPHASSSTISWSFPKKLDQFFFTVSKISLSGWIITSSAELWLYFESFERHMRDILGLSG